MQTVAYIMVAFNFIPSGAAYVHVKPYDTSYADSSIHFGSV